MNVLGICGSLQSASSNLLVLATVAQRLPPSIAFTRSEVTGDLPGFNPDLDVDPPHRAVALWRRQLAEADAVVICTPEYAHSYPGALKNALDWVVGSGELVDKPVALITAGPSGGRRALDALAPVLQVISSDLVGSLAIGAVRQKYDGDLLTDVKVLTQLDDLLARLVAAATSRAADS